MKAKFQRLCCCHPFIFHVHIFVSTHVICVCVSLAVCSRAEGQMLCSPPPSVLLLTKPWRMPWQLPYRHSTISTAAQPIPHTSLRLTSLMAPESGRKVQLSGLLMGTVDMTLKQTHNGTGCNTGPTYTVLFDMRKACGWKADMANWWWFWQHRWQSCRIYVFIICLNSLGSLVTEWELWIVHFNSLRHLYLSTYIPGSAKARPMSLVIVRPGSCGCRKSMRWDLRNVSIDNNLLILVFGVFFIWSYMSVNVKWFQGIMAQSMHFYLSI